MTATHVIITRRGSRLTTIKEKIEALRVMMLRGISVINMEGRLNIARLKEITPVLITDRLSFWNPFYSLIKRKVIKQPYHD